MAGTKIGTVGKEWFYTMEKNSQNTVTGIWEWTILEYRYIKLLIRFMWAVHCRLVLWDSSKQINFFWGKITKSFQTKCKTDKKHFRISRTWKKLFQKSQSVDRAVQLIFGGKPRKKPAKSQTRTRTIPLFTNSNIGITAL